ncbi:hypothetical protein [Geobacter sp. AOG1]|uniref:hypothetical protein n=1 Tax=Geobacter sp. AOG1 TaxID=1566346 RepID=UPI001CC5B3C5|nr:hypothetical protein [Geobacter sp. AOG1]GFE57082.1 polyketide cyclase [Geobacter sp. AOG1]
MIYPSTTISMQIAREPAAVYAFVSALENFPLWATTFCKSIRKEQDNWVMETSLGPMSIRLAPQNSLGVLDHYVTPPSGETLYVPLRVVTNGSGSEMLFTLFRLPGVSDEAYAADAALVRQDLNSLKELLER